MEKFFVLLSEAYETITTIDYIIKLINNEIKQVISVNQHIINYSQSFSEINDNILICKFPTIIFNLYKINFSISYKDIIIKTQNIKDIELIKQVIYNIMSEKLSSYFLK